MTRQRGVFVETVILDFHFIVTHQTYSRFFLYLLKVHSIYISTWVPKSVWFVAMYVISTLYFNTWLIHTVTAVPNEVTFQYILNPNIFHFCGSIESKLWPQYDQSESVKEVIPILSGCLLLSQYGSYLLFLKKINYIHSTTSWESIL